MFNKTVNGVLETFNKAVTDLETIRSKQHEKAIKLSGELADAEEERDHAERVANKLGELLK